MKLISMTFPMNKNFSAVIHIDPIIGYKWYDDGDDDVMVSSINLRLTDLER